MAELGYFGAEIPQFDMDAETTTLAEKWREWKIAIGYMIKAKGITDADRQEAVLLHAGGFRLQQIYVTLPDAANPPEDASVFDKAVLKLDNYFAPKSNEPFERHKFRKMKQENGENVGHFVAKLKRQAQYCAFTDKDTQIRDQLIEGCLAARLRKLFLEKGNALKLDNALEIASSFEAVQFQSNEMNSENVNRVELKRHDKRKQDYKKDYKKEKPESKSCCWRCGKPGHFAKDSSCPAKQAKCSKCKLIGHFEVVCRTKEFKHGKADKKGYRKPKVYTVEEDSGEEDDFAFMVLSELSSKEEPTVDLEVGGQVVNVLIDSGASCNVIDEKLWSKLQEKGIQCTSVQVNQTLKPYATSDRLEVTDKFKTSVKVMDTEINDVEFLVIKGRAKPLLGRKTATELGVLVIKVPEINRVEKDLIACSVARSES